MIIAAALLPRAAQAQSASSGTLRLALIEGDPLSVSVNLTEPLEKLVKTTTGAVLVEERLVPSFYAGNDFRFRVSQLDLPPTQPAAVLDAGNQIVVVFPPDPTLVAALQRAAADPSSFESMTSVSLSTRATVLASAHGPQDEALISVLVDPKAEPARWRDTVAQLVQLRWNGRDEYVIVAGRVLGQMGRMATVLEEEAGRGPFLGIARGNVFPNADPYGRGPDLVKELARLGLRYSGVSTLELTHWNELAAYRASTACAVQFLSANLVYSSAPATSILPDSVIVPVGGLRVAIVGLTPPRAARYLRRAGLSQATVLYPLEALRSRLPALRAKADVVVALLDIGDDTSDLPLRAGGVDIFAARSLRSSSPFAPPERALEQHRRGPFQPPLLTIDSYDLALTTVEADVTVADGASHWKARQRDRLLDDSVEPAPDWPEFDPAKYGLTYSTEAPLLPPAAALFPAQEGPQRSIGPRDFWSLAAGLGARATGAELGLLRAAHLMTTLEEGVPESVVRVWLDEPQPAVLVTVKGSALRGLLAEADAQRQREQNHRFETGLVYTYGGVDPGPKINGVPLDDMADYKVFTSLDLAETLELGHGQPPRPTGRTVGEIVLEALKTRAGSAPEEVRAWMEGKALDHPGLWRINFRDVGINLQKTQVARSDAFNSVPNARIQGFDEVDVGETFKADAEYLRDPLRWTNTLEMEYMRSDLRPRGQPPVTNVTANRIMLLTMGTRRVGGISEKWLAQSWGPSLGLQFDSEFEPQPGLRRKQIYSAYPGVQFYDGTWIKSLEASGNVKRDLSRIPPNTQYGLHGRVLVAHDIATASNGAINLQGELWDNYFFNTHSDTIQDLRVEGDANLKLRIPFRKYLSIAPFVDFYWFALKVQPVWGYSLMTGVQVGFSRLWKPQFQPLFGER